MRRQLSEMTKSKSTYDILHLDNLKPSIEFWHKVRRTRERYGTRTHETPPKSTVLSDSLTEWAALNIKTMSTELQIAWVTRTWKLIAKVDTC